MPKILAALLLAVSASLPAAAQDHRPPEFRLGDAATPRSYDVRFAIDPRESAFEGEIRIELRVNRATPVLWMNAEKLEIASVRFLHGEREIPVRVVPAAADFVGFEAEGGFPAADLVAAIRYRGPIEPVATRGIFRQREAREWYVVSQFEAMNARRAMPCFDEPGWKVPWRVTIDAPASEVAVSNTPATSVTDLPDRSGWKRHVFAQTRPLPSYLVAFAVGPYDAVAGAEAGTRPTPMRYLAPKGRGIETRWAREIGPPILAALETYFGMPYPFEKLDSVTIPSAFGFGAMENVGMITYSSDVLLSQPERESLAFRRLHASVAAHEMGHMWFGNLVTLAWWDDIWLNEAFASWIARKAIRGVRPDWAGGWRQGFTRRRALFADRLVSARRIANPVANKSDVSAAFDQITYAKGAEVLAMFETWMGPERFQSGVRAFMTRNAYGNATSQDFFAALGEAAGRGPSAVAAFRSFVDQPGLPMLDVALKCARGGASVEVVQQRFRPRGAPAAEGQWTTPACFSYESAGRVHKQCAEITGRHAIKLAEARSCPRWLLGNADGAGHWIARYPKASFKTLVSRAAELPNLEAMALANDTGLMAQTGLVARDDALQLADALLAHKAIGVRHGAVELLENMRRDRLGAEERQRLAAVVARRLLPLAGEIGWREREGDDMDVQDLRALLLPFVAEFDAGSELRYEARVLALRWAGDRKFIAQSTVVPVLSTAARHADIATFTRLEHSMVNAQDRRDRNELVKALALARDPALRARALSLVDTQALDGREAYTFLESGLRDEGNRGAFFEHLLTHWEALLAKLPAESAARLIARLEGLCSRAERDAFVAFFAPKAAGHLGGRKAYEQSLEAMDVCIAAYEK